MKFTSHLCRSLAEFKHTRCQIMGWEVVVSLCPWTKEEPSLAATISLPAYVLQLAKCAWLVLTWSSAFFIHVTTWLFTFSTIYQRMLRWIDRGGRPAYRHPTRVFNEIASISRETACRWSLGKCQFISTWGFEGTHRTASEIPPVGATELQNFFAAGLFIGP